MFSKTILIFFGLMAVLAALAASVWFGWLGFALAAMLLVAVVVAVTVWNRLWAGVALIAFTLPFERIGSIETGAGTIRVSQLLILLILVTWLFRGLFRKKLEIPLASYWWPLAGFMVMTAISGFLAINQGRAVVVFALTTMLMIFALLLPAMVQTKKQLLAVLGALTLGAVIVTLFGLFQFVGDVVGIPPAITGLRELYTSQVFGFPRVQSTALEPLYFANYLLLPLGVALALFLAGQKMFWPTFVAARWQSVLHVLTILLMGLVFVLTLSRGAYLGLAALLALLAWYYRARVWRAKVVVSLVIIVAVVAVVGIALLRFSGDGFGDITLDTFVGQATNYTEGAGVLDRYHTYDQAWQLFLAHPWLGVGVGNFGPAVSYSAFVAPADGWPIVNNEPLELLAETGILGLATLTIGLLMIGLFAIGAIRKSDNIWFKALMIGLMATLFGMIVQYQTFSILFVAHIWFAVGLLLVVAHMAKLKSGTSSDSGRIA